MSGSTITITGASGVVGVEVAARLAASGYSVIALVHNQSSLVLNSGRNLKFEWGHEKAAPGTVCCLRTDVRAPRLGLGEREYEALASKTDLVINSAAITDFNRAKHVYDAINVQGTAHSLAFADADPGRRIPFLHVSTAYVCGERSGPILESELDCGQAFGNGYEFSKFQAEHLVHAAAESGLHTAIARPGIVVGDTRLGRTREFKHIYIVMKMLSEGKVRSIPANFDATLDLVPVDYVADGISALAERMDLARDRTIHLVNGNVTTLGDFSEVMAKYPFMHVPRFVPPKSFDSATMESIERRLYDHTIRIFESYFRNKRQFIDTDALELVGDRLPRIPHGQKLLRRQIDYCERVGYLGYCRPPGDEAVAPGEAR